MHFLIYVSIFDEEKILFPEYYVHEEKISSKSLLSAFHKAKIVRLLFGVEGFIANTEILCNENPENATRYNGPFYNMCVQDN